MPTKVPEKFPGSDWCSGDLADMFTEIYRLDCEIWGHPLDAAILRCIAATQWKTGRCARVTGIANTLNTSVTTVHDRLSKLREHDNRTPIEGPVVYRSESGGYYLTSHAEQMVRDAIASLRYTLEIYARRNRSHRQGSTNQDA